MNDFYFFNDGPLSQGYQLDFEINGVVYSSCEQYLMAQKALLFKDTEAYTNIMSTKDPQKQKEFGRLVKNFDYKKWNDSKQQICFECNYTKFKIDGEHRELFMKNIDKEFVYDDSNVIWGIGTVANTEEKMNPETWNGENLLGDILTDVAKAYKSGRFVY